MLTFYAVIVVVIQIIIFILGIILFFKIWTMTNHVREIKDFLKTKNNQGRILNKKTENKPNIIKED